jgi:hypothetical protein
MPQYRMRELKMKMKGRESVITRRRDGAVDKRREGVITMRRDGDSDEEKEEGRCHYEEERWSGR